LKGNAVIVNDNLTYEIAGERIEEIIKDSIFKEVDVYIKEPGFPTTLEVKEIQERVSSLKANVVFGIGGGVCMDAAKAVALNLKETVSCITVPTSAATDAMCTHHAVISDVDKAHVDWSLIPRGAAPIGTIIDVDIIVNAPYRLTATGFADWFAKYICNRDIELAYAHGMIREYNEYIIDISNATVNMFVEKAKLIKNWDENAWNMFLQAMMHDGIIEILGAPLGGSEHSVGMILQKEGKVYHGEGVGLGIILKGYHYGENEGEVAKKTLEDAGAPTSAAQLGIADEDVIDALVEASNTAKKHADTRYSILTEKPLTRDSAEKLAKKSGIID